MLLKLLGGIPWLARGFLFVGPNGALEFDLADFQRVSGVVADAVDFPRTLFQGFGHGEQIAQHGAFGEGDDPFHREHFAFAACFSLIGCGCLAGHILSGELLTYADGQVVKGELGSG